MERVVSMMAMLMLAGVINYIFMGMINDWAPTFQAWAAATPPDGPGLTGAQLAFVDRLPTYLVIGMILASLALAMPAAVRVGR